MSGQERKDGRGVVEEGGIRRKSRGDGRMGDKEGRHGRSDGEMEGGGRKTRGEEEGGMGDEEGRHGRSDGEMEGGGRKRRGDGRRDGRQGGETWKE